MAKVLIYSPNILGKSIAGAAIRSLEFAKSLSQEHQVVLLSPGDPQIQDRHFEVVSFQNPIAKKHFQDADVLIAQRLTLPLALMARRHGLKIIIDAYDPSPLELLEHFKTEPMQKQHQKILSEVSTLLFSFKMAHGILCASEKQRELWIGFLLAQKLITPVLYRQDSSLRHFIDVVPFGLPCSLPQKKGQGLREKYGFHVEDKVILWGGGIWDWFDPLSLIKAIKILSQSRRDIKLVFMGVKPPDPQLAVTSMSAAAMKLAEELGVLNQFVFFNQEWIPYEERQNFLLDANIGASIHFNHLETQFSFRTRILDYVWAGLPILTTEGDHFSELVERCHLGSVVPFENPEAIVAAILALVDHPSRLQEIKHRLAIMREKFYWTSVTAPLNEMIKRFNKCELPNRFWQDGKTMLKFIFTKIREKGVKACWEKFYEQFLSKKSQLQGHR